MGADFLPNSYGRFPAGSIDGRPYYGFDDKGRPIFGYSAQGRPICNGKGGKCRDPNRMDNGRCYRCGGKSVSGAEHPAFVNGSDSKPLLGARAIKNMMTASKGKGELGLIERSVQKISDIVDGDDMKLALDASKFTIGLVAEEIPVILSSAQSLECVIQAIVETFNPTEEEFEKWQAAYKGRAQAMAALV